MVLMPVIGVFLVKDHASLYPPREKSEYRVEVFSCSFSPVLRFVCILLSGTPAAANQLVITQLYNPEGTAHTLARFLLLQCESAFIGFEK